MIDPARFALSVALLGLLVACGGGSGGDSAAPTADADPASIATPGPSGEPEVGITDLMREAAALEPVARYEPDEDVEPAAAATGAMSVARGSHTASLLGNGVVLVQGGSRDPSTPEVYDPETGEWTSTPEVATPRTSASSTVLLDGTLLVAGGRGESGIVASAKLYDPSSGTWSATGDMTEPRRSHTATLLEDGAVLIVGGETTAGAAASAEIFDPSSGTWSAVAGMSAARTGHTADLLNDGRVLVTGGATFAGTIDAAETYDPSSGEWASAGTMAEPRISHVAVVLDDGKVLIVGGQGLLLAPFLPLDSAEIYDPVSEQWSQVGVMVEPRSLAAAVLLGDGRVLLTGGRDKTALDSAEMFDPATLGWTLVQGLTEVRRSHTATILPDGSILIAGGRDDAGRLATAELYRPQE